MTEEPKTEGATPTKTAPEAEEEKTQTDLPALMKAEELLTKLAEKESSLLEREKLLDEKIKAFDKAAASARMGGFGTVAQEKTEDQKNLEAANALLRGSGYKADGGEYDAFITRKK